MQSSQFNNNLNKANLAARCPDKFFFSFMMAAANPFDAGQSVKQWVVETDAACECECVCSGFMTQGCVCMIEQAACLW